MSAHNMFSSRNKKNIMWIPPLICSYVCYLFWKYGLSFFLKKNYEMNIEDSNELSSLLSNSQIVAEDILNYHNNPCYWDREKAKQYRPRSNATKCNILWSVLHASHSVVFRLTHCSRETRKRVIGKQCRPRSDAAECGIWSGSPLFANSLAIFL